MGGSQGPFSPGTQGDIDRAIESLDHEGKATQERARKLIELGQAHEVMKQNIVKSAAIVSGRVQASKDGEYSFGDTELENAKARNVQAISGGIAAAISLAWITYFGTDMPAELYAVVPVFLQVGAQALATAFNTKKGK